MKKEKLQTLQINNNLTLKQAMQRLNETATQILFVTDHNERLIGTVTDGDIRRGIINGCQLSGNVDEIMSRHFFSINGDVADLKDKARELMIKHTIEHIPVLNGEKRIINLISWLDFFRNDFQEENKKSKENCIVIMAGGKGTRLDPFTRILPKSLIPVRNKPVIEHIMEGFLSDGFHKFKLIVNYKKEMLKLYFYENKLPYEIEFIEESDYYGTAGGLSLLRETIKDTFIVSNTDTILEENFNHVLEWHKNSGYLLTIIASHKEIMVPYGVINMSNGDFVGIDEKPGIDMFVNTGTYVFEPKILDLINNDEYMDMDKLITKIADKYNNSIGVFHHLGQWLDLGQWEEYRKSLKYIEGNEDSI